MRKSTARGVCECQDGSWGVPTTAGPADKHDPPPHGATLWCQGSTTDGATRFFILNFALKDPGTRALALMHPWKEHTFLRRGSWYTKQICDSSIPKTNEDPPPLILFALLQGRVGGEQGLMGGHKFGQAGAKKPPADPMAPVAQNLGQNGQWKAEKPRLELRSREASFLIWALLLRSTATWGRLCLWAAPAGVRRPQGPWR
jgi:hypothetical protein